MTMIGIYHKGCIDGTAAAAVLLRKFPDVKLFPLSHAYTKEELQNIISTTHESDEVYTVDCGLGVKEFLSAGYKVTTLDHHISIKEDLEKLEEKYPKYSYVFNNDKLGASLAWSYFFSNEREPEVVKYVEDSDLWRWEYGDDTKYVNSYLSMFKDNPAAMLECIEGDISDIKEKGELIAAYADTVIERIVKTKPITLRLGEHQVPAFNITLAGYESACGNILSEQLDTAVVMFTIQGDRVRLSMRSKDHHTPTSLQLAETLGGGGHKNAAGADISLKEFWNYLVNEA